MADDVSIVVGIRGDASGGRIIKKTLDDVAASGDKAVTATKRLELQAKATSVAADAMSRAFSAIAAVAGLAQIAKMADQYTMLEGRIKLATRSASEFSQAFAGLKQVSNETGGSLSDAVDVFQRLSFVRDEIGATVGQMVQFTGTVQKMGVMSGASTTAMSAGLLQLGQALSAGVVRAEEFNSVVENTPVIAKAIADQFGVTTGQLRQLVLKGLVDSADVFNAVLNQAAEVQQKYAEMPVTIGRALSQLNNQFMEFIGVNAQASGASMAVVGVLDGLRLAVFGVGKAFDLIANGIGIVAQSILTTIQNLANGAIGVVNFITEQANRIPGVNTPLVGKVNFAADWSEINAAAGAANDQFLGGKTPTTVFDKMAGGSSDFAASSPVKAMSKDYADLASKISNTTKLTTEQRDAIREKKKEAADALREEKKLQDRLKDAVKDSRTETERLYDKIAEQEALRPFAKTAEQVTAISKNIRNAQDELEKLRIKAELDSPTGKAFQNLAKEIDDDFKDAFKDMFKESDGGFKKLINGWKNAFKDFLADLAYQAAVRPILVSLASSVGGAMGLSSGATASVLGTGGGSGGSGGGSLLGAGSSLFSAGRALLSGGLQSGVGNFSAKAATGAYSLFSKDIYSATLFGDKVGDFMASASSFANIAGGLVGGLGANLLGLGNKNGLVNAGTGLSGGLIGQALIPVPFLGAAVGSFVGTALGGLFGGGKPSDKSQWGELNLATLQTSKLGGLGGKKLSAENQNFRDKAFAEASALAQLFQSVGATTSGQISAVIGNRDGLRLNTGSGVQNFGNNAQAFIDSMMQAVLQGTTGLTGTFKTIVDKIGVSDTKKLAAAFEFGKQFDEFIKGTDKTQVDVLKETLDALNAQFAVLKQQTLDLGLPIDKLTAAYDKQKDIVLGSLKAQMAGFSSLEDMTNAFKSFLDSQALGSNSSLSPTDKLALAQDNFGSLLSKAQGGDLSVTQDLLKAANQLLDIGRDVYASSVSFVGLEGFVRSSVQGVARQAGVPGYESADPTGGLSAEIVRINTQLNGSVTEMVEVLKELYTEAVRTRKLQESIRNQQAVA